MEGKEVIVISSSPEKDRMLSNISCKQEDDDGSTLLKKNMDMMEDCFILDFNPFDSMNIAKLSFTIQDAHDDDDDDDLTVVAEKGKVCLYSFCLYGYYVVACRDYPHSRHLCLRFPFDKTPHEKHCYLACTIKTLFYFSFCYCYVCDSVAPCEFWTIHCHASEHVEDWKSQRELMRLKIRRQIGF
ncbi:hypothetical protein Goklo_009565 [Gossypium klotzschianum]|uniref:Uncharacterized protein n=1 Tax=Gossypium klotzschianum TaxID=34286 RepID=A0A7J8V377_9ROSI|nr:hypothetical protein [Gossypium klotzschianum]